MAKSVCRELARHSIAEEIVVYPAFEKYIENGKAMADEHSPLATASDTRIVLLMQLSTGHRMKRQPVFWFRRQAKTPFDNTVKAFVNISSLCTEFTKRQARMSFRVPTPLINPEPRFS